MVVSARSRGLVPAAALAALALTVARPAPAAEPGAAEPEAARPGAARAADGAEHHLIDMVVAQVDATVITLSELVAETRLYLLRTGGPEVARAARLSQGLLTRVLRVIVSRELLLGEIRRLKLRDVPDQDVARAIADLERRFAAPSDWQRFLERTGLREAGPAGRFGAPSGLVAIVLAELEVERFLDVRIRRNLSVRESDLVLCYEVNRPLFGAQPLDEVRERIRERILEDREIRARDALVRDLEKKVTVRYAPGFELEATDEPEEGFGLRCPEAPRGAEP